MARALPLRRQLLGLLAGVLGLPALTIVLAHLRDELTLPSVLLLFLLTVVGVAAVGGVWPALLASVAAFLTVNWWFTPPYYTWTIAEREHVLALVVFLVVAGVVSLYVTIAAHRAEEAALARAESESLGQANTLRTALLSAVSHDLRTPLSSIKASVSSLRAQDVQWPPPVVEDFLATIEDETDRLAELVANLLDMSRVSTGTIELTQRRVGLDEVVASAVSSLGGRGHDAAVDVPEDLPRVLADPGLLERAVANLITNALAWSPPGGVVRIEGARQGPWAELRVVDRGPGIPVADRAKVFEPFQRLGDRSRGGVGLGLAVARGFVEVMQGQLAVEDTPGGGLTMVVRLPVAETVGANP